MIFVIISSGKAICESILLRVSFYLNSVTKLWDMIIRLCMCKGGTYHVKVLVSKFSWKTTNKLRSAFPITVNSKSIN